MANRWTKLAALSAELNTKTLNVRPLHRSYISQQDALYDYTVGHDFIVVDQSSPLNNCLISVCDRHELKRTYDLTHLNIKYNPGLTSIEVAL